jgi:nucleoside-diphosphate-sugar epimerase
MQRFKDVLHRAQKSFPLSTYRYSVIFSHKNKSKEKRKTKKDQIETMPESKKVIVFGSSGGIGSKLVEILSKEQPSWEIVAVSRSSAEKFAQYSNVKVVPGDATNKTEVMELTADKDIVYACIGFPKYEKKYWATTWPIVLDNLLEGTAQREGQKFVFCDNLYAYGPTQNISPKTSRVPANSKSKLGVRALLHEKFQKRMSDSPDSMMVVGSADFFGPGITDVTFLGDTFTKAILEGKKAPIAIGSSSKIHDFAYAPDFSNALYIASNNDKAYGKFWVCPTAIHDKSMDQIAADVARLAECDSKKAKVTAYPGWSIKLLSPFMSFMREMVEMLPFWTNDYSVDDSDFCSTFGVKPTPYEEALKEYIAFYKSSLLEQ